MRGDGLHPAPENIRKQTTIGPGILRNTSSESKLNYILQPWQLLLLILAGWLNQQQFEAIENLKTENKILREKLGKKRILLNDNQRRRLAVKGKVLGHKRLKEIGSIFSPDTILRWHRKLVAKKWDYSDRPRKNGRPETEPEVVALIVKLAQENPAWGYDRIAGALKNLGHNVSDQTIGNILKKHGIEPAPERRDGMSWATFLKAHWETLAAIDFTNIEVWTSRGLVTVSLLFAIELKTRRVHFAGCTTSSDGGQAMRQRAKNMTDCEDGFLNGKTHLIMDRDTRFSKAFRKIPADEGIESVRLPPRSPDMNAFMERFMRSLKEEALNRMIFFGEPSLRNAVKQYLIHYHEERNHQGLGNRLIIPLKTPPDTSVPVETTERLGGILRSYRRVA